MYLSFKITLHLHLIFLSATYLLKKKKQNCATNGEKSSKGSNCVITKLVLLIILVLVHLYLFHKFLLIISKVSTAGVYVSLIWSLVLNSVNILLEILM